MPPDEPPSPHLVQCLAAILRKLKSHELNETDNEKVEHMNPTWWPEISSLPLSPPLSPSLSPSPTDDGSSLECL